MSTPIRTLARTLALTLVTLLATAGPAAAAEPPTDFADFSELSELNELSETDRFDAANTVEGQVNINTASAAELELVPGIGPATSARIIAYRNERPFQQRNHIMRIKGVGQKTFAKIKDYLIVEGETTLQIVK